MLDDFLSGCVCALIAAVLFAATGTLFDEAPRQPVAQATTTLPTVVVTVERAREGDRLAQVR